MATTTTPVRVTIERPRHWLGNGFGYASAEYRVSVNGTPVLLIQRPTSTWAIYRYTDGKVGAWVGSKIRFADARALACRIAAEEA